MLYASLSPEASRVLSVLVESRLSGGRVLKDPVDTARLYLHGLASLHLGRTVPVSQIDTLLERFPLCRVAPGEAAFREGEAGNSALLVIRGLLEASIRTTQGERSLGRAGPWDVVGETALYAPDRLRSATVRGRTETTCLRLDPALMESHEDDVIAALEAHLLHTLSHRIRVTNLNLQIRQKGERTPHAFVNPSMTTGAGTDLASCAGFMLAAHPFLEARASDLEKILAQGDILNLKAGDRLCSQSDPSDRLYFLVSGAIDIDHKNLTSESHRVGVEQAPAILGHMGLIDRTRRGANCTARVPCRVIQLHSDSFWVLIRDTTDAGTVLRRLLLSSLTRQLVDGNERISRLIR